MSKLPPRIIQPKPQKKQYSGRNMQDAVELPAYLQINDRNASPLQMKKKPPFVSTTKRNQTFGDPPPKQSILTSKQGLRGDSSIVVSNKIEGQMSSQTNNTSSSQNKQGNRDEYHPNIVSNDFIEDDCIYPSFNKLFQRLSLRWLQLTKSLWILAVLDANRKISDREGFTNFYQVMKWRADGEISEDEFSVLYLEWMGPNEHKLSPTSKRDRKSYQTIGMNTLRQILLENNMLDESILDMYIGMLINEINKHLIGNPLTYQPNNDYIYDPRVDSKIEICSDKWLMMTEELFFLLDCAGYGFLSFDEIYFLSSCLIIGLRNWSNEFELIDDLSVGMISAYTLQFFLDCNAYIPMNYHYESSSRLSINNKQSLNPSITCKCVITLPMFKTILIKRGLSKSALSLLIDHVKKCIERLNFVCSRSNSSTIFETSQTPSNPFDSLLLSFYPLESNDSIGSPRLWQLSVLSTVGYTNIESIQSLIQSNAYSSTSTHIIPSIIVYLLTDADRFMSGILRSSEQMISNQDLSMKNPSTSISKILNEYRESIYQIWSGYHKWCLNTGQQNTYTSGDVVALDLSKDSIYKLISAIVLKYKSYQHLCSQAIIETAKYYFNNTPYMYDNNDLSMICMQVLPDIEYMLIELGYGDDTRSESSHRSNRRNRKTSDDSKITNKLVKSSKQSNQSIDNTDPKIATDSSAILEKPSNELPDTQLFIQPGNSTIFAAVDESKESSNPIKESKWKSLFNMRNDNKADAEDETTDERLFGIHRNKTPPVSKTMLSSRDKEPSETLTARSSRGNRSPEKISSIGITAKKTVPSTVSPDIVVPTVIPSESNSKGIATIDTTNRESTLDNEDKSTRPSTADKIQLFDGPFDSIQPTQVNPKPSLKSPNRRLSDSTGSADKNNIQIAMKGIIDELVVTTDKEQQTRLINALNVLRQLDDDGKKQIKSTTQIESSRNKPKSSVVDDKPNNITTATVRSDAEAFKSKIPSPEKKRPLSTSAASSKQTVTFLQESHKPRNQSEEEQSTTQHMKPTNDVSAALGSEIIPSKPVIELPNISTVTNANSSLLLDSPMDLKDLPAPSSQTMSKDLVNESMDEKLTGLFERGQDAGGFAQALRDILRKMSRDDSDIKVKSLEEILKLGHEIVERETERLKEKSPPSAKRSSANNSSSRIQSKQVSSMRQTYSRSPVRRQDTSLDRSISQTANQRIRKNENILFESPPPPPPPLESSATIPASSTKPSTVSQISTSMGSVAIAQKSSRPMKIPGQLPSDKKKITKKAFGHPV